MNECNMQTWLKYAKPGDGLRIKEGCQLFLTEDKYKACKNAFFIGRFKKAWDTSRYSIMIGVYETSFDCEQIESFAFNEGEEVMVGNDVGTWDRRLYGSYHCGSHYTVDGEKYSYAIPVHVYEAWQKDLKTQEDKINGKEELPACHPPIHERLAKLEEMVENLKGKCPTTFQERLVLLEERMTEMEAKL